MKNIVVIPARGGSKAVPRKNLRPLNGKPLIAYAIKAALDAKEVHRVVVSTEDEEISLFAKRFGAEVIGRPENLAGDNVTLDPVVVHTSEEAERKWNETYTYIVTVQPTSPLVMGNDIDRGIRKIAEEGSDTLISVVEDKHLRWEKRGQYLVPAYEKRVNRQELPETFHETGAVIVCTRQQLNMGSRIGKNISILVIDKFRSIDIDTYYDFWVAEMIMQRKRIMFVAIGNSGTGMGHVYRAVMLAHELIHHEIIFVCKTDDDLAKQFIGAQNYTVVGSTKEHLIETIISLKPDMVINDILDTSSDYILTLKKAGMKVVNFEDLGLGAETADLVINALYPTRFPQDHIKVGPSYFCLRDEFLHINRRDRSGDVKTFLIAFGGVDEGNLTCLVLEAAAVELAKRQILIHVVLGPGYRHHGKLNELIELLGLENINVIKSTNKISEYMNASDIAITSAGRTVLELASICVPMVVIAQNAREMTHRVASSDNGIIHLGHRNDVTGDLIRDAVVRLIEDAGMRERMVRKMRRLDITDGKKRVVQEIMTLLRT